MTVQNNQDLLLMATKDPSFSSAYPLSWSTHIRKALEVMGVYRLEVASSNRAKCNGTCLPSPGIGGPSARAMVEWVDEGAD